VRRCQNVEQMQTCQSVARRVMYAGLHEPHRRGTLLHVVASVLLDQQSTSLLARVVDRAKMQPLTQ